MNTTTTTTRPPCDCGNPSASWQGTLPDLRTYQCDECWRRAKRKDRAVPSYLSTWDSYQKLSLESARAEAEKIAMRAMIQTENPDNEAD